MSYFRSYFSKNNTLIKERRVNTAKNPNTEIFYGPEISRFIFSVDITDLRTKLNNGDLVLNEKTIHNLNLTNTIFGDESLLGQENSRERERATSFSLIVFGFDESWDEGVGFAYEETEEYGTGNKSFDQRPSNWYNRTTLDSWSQEGIYSFISGDTLSGATLITSVDFDNGNENLLADITSYVNTVLTGTTDNEINLGIAFHPDYELIIGGNSQSVAFFTKYTQTFFEPYIETIFDDSIRDDRYNFVGYRENYLYLYVTKGTNFYDLDQLPTVDILDSNSNPIEGFTGLTVNKVRKGIYQVSLGLSGVICDGNRFFYDKWCNIYIDNINMGCITQKFIPKPYTAGYTIGENQTELERYVIQYFGVKFNEKIKRGENRKIVVTLRSINNQTPVLWDDVYYRIYLKEGLVQVNVFEWTKLDKTNENSFFLDTSYMIPREYFLEIKAKTHTEEIFYREEIKFEIVSEK